MLSCFKDDDVIMCHTNTTFPCPDFARLDRYQNNNDNNTAYNENDDKWW